MTGQVLRLRCPRVEDTLAMGERLGRALMPGDLVVLSGELGAGKTVLVRGMALGAGIHEGTVRSPTFVLHHVYRGPRLLLHHIDCYRLGPGADLTVLDLETLLAGGAVVVEWGEYADLDAYQPVRITIDSGDPEARVMCCRSDGVPDRLRAAWDGEAGG